MNSSNKTFLPINDYTNRNWLLIDCKGQSLGRLATIITGLLKGKIKLHYHSSIDIGDYVILINADSVILNENAKHHLVYNPGRPGSSLKIKKVSDCLPKLTIECAVKGMLTNTEKKRLMKRLMIYNDNNHPHQAQNPMQINLSNINENTQVNN